MSVAPLRGAEESGLEVAAAKKPFDPHFVKPTAVDGAKGLLPPPAPGSLAARSHAGGAVNAPGGGAQ